LIVYLGKDIGITANLCYHIGLISFKPKMTITQLKKVLEFPLQTYLLPPLVSIEARRLEVAKLRSILFREQEALKKDIDDFSQIKNNGYKRKLIIDHDDQ
jgi:hypothetical protein